MKSATDGDERKSFLNERLLFYKLMVYVVSQNSDVLSSTTYKYLAEMRSILIEKQVYLIMIGTERIHDVFRFFDRSKDA